MALTTAPLMATIAAAIRLTSGAPVLFRQERLGLNGRVFSILKFRTMREAFDAHGAPLADEKRVTPIGRLLRRTRMDELPELLNIVRGDLSLVGPRPLLPQQFPPGSELGKRRHCLRPGLTGWAQVNGNTKLTWEQKMALDLWYVEHASLLLDLKIVAKTLLVVIAGEKVAPHPLQLAMDHAHSTRWSN